MDDPVATHFQLSAAEFTPAYLDFGVAELHRRAAAALDLLRSCEVCPRDCHINRLEDRWSFCKIGRYALVSSAFPHFGEEDCLRGWNGSGTIFFSMCNLRCVFCLPPDARVLTDQGVQRIADIFDSGDGDTALDGGRVRFLSGIRAYTATGELASISKAFCRPYHGELVTIKPYGLPLLTLTPNHMVFVARHPGGPVEKLRADNISESYYLVVPKPHDTDARVEFDGFALLSRHGGSFRSSPVRKASPAVLRQFASIGAYRKPTSREIAQQLGYHPAYMRGLLVRIRRGEVDLDAKFVRNDLVERDGRVRFKTEKGPGIPQRITLDPNLARLLGYFCAEGYVSSSRDRPNSHRLIFSFGPHERDVAKRVAGLLGQIFGYEATVLHRRTAVTVEVGSASLATFFAHLCGNRAKTKRVPSVLLTARTGVIRAFLESYWEGDGCVVDDQMSASTISEDLAVGLMALFLRIGIFPYYYATRRTPSYEIEGRTVRQSETLYYVKCRRDAWKGDSAARHVRYKETAEVFLVPIRRISRAPYEGPVYNLEVAHEDHSYTAAGVAVGNCQNFDISQERAGRAMRPEELARSMLALQDRGCHNINFVTPEHVVPQILEALPLAVEMGLRLPIVYNTSAYDSMHSLRLLDGIVDIYMPDFKFWDREMSRFYLKAPDYPEVARRTIAEMHRQVGPLRLDEQGLAKRGVLIRHLVMPDGIAGTQEIMRWIAAELSVHSYVNVMAQYYPAGKVGKDPKYSAIDRRVYPEEFEDAIRAAEEAGLCRLDLRVPEVSPRLRQRHRR